MDKELFLKKCQESMEDVVGWKIFLFFPQNIVWRFFIVGTIVASFLINTTDLFYLMKKEDYTDVLDLIQFLCDCFYSVDTVCATLHYVMYNTRKLRHGKKRHLALLLLDYISLLPLNLVYRHVMYYNEEESQNVYDLLRIHTSLRMYQIYMAFNDVKFKIYKGHLYFIVLFLEIILYLLILTHALSCFLIYDSEATYIDFCMKDIMACILENEVTTFYLLSQGFIEPLSGYTLKNHKTLAILDFMTGYVFTFGYIAPMLVFASLKYLRGYFDFSNRFKQLNLFVNNVVEEKKMKEEILLYFQNIWAYGKGSRHPEILEVFPLCFRKNMFCDVHWEAFRHSDFLQCLSLGCKRSLALYMRTDFLGGNQVLLHKSEKKQHFIFLESGMLQIMAEENINFPVINFSNGTVLGEVNFFFNTESKATLRTAKFSVLHFLRFRDLFRVMLDYPVDMKKMFKRMRLRLKIAKSIQTRKLKICPKFVPNESTYEEVRKQQADIKWLKQQYRAVMDLHKANLLDSQDSSIEARFRYQRQQQNLKTQMEHTSVYLPLISINDEVVNMQGVVCLKMSFPCFVDPQSNFLVKWNWIVITAVSVCSVMYPLIIGWYPYVPAWFFDVSAVITIIYTIDIMIQLFTAVKVRNAIIPKARAVYVARATSITFYIDIFAALPLQTLFYVGGNGEPFEYNFYFANALLKTYKLFPFLGKWNYSYSPNPLLRTYIKYSIILFLSIYWLAAFLNITGVQCALGSCQKNDWYGYFVERKGTNYKDHVSVYMALFIGLDIPYELLQTKQVTSYIYFFAAFIYFRLLFFAWQTECTSAYVLENSPKLNYENLTDLVLNFMQKRSIVPGIKKRVMKTMRFQWDFDYGNFITQKHRIMDDLEDKLKASIDRQSVIPTLASSMLFDSEEEMIYMDLCRRVQRLALPANSVLITFGTQTMSIYVIHKGFVQLNSFLPKDLVQNVATPIVMRSGNAFPVIMAFNQRPAAVSARTLTDCELLILNLEDMLSTMMIHGLFRDVVEATKDTDLSGISQARLGFSKVQDVFKITKKEFDAPFRKIPPLFRIIKVFFIKKAIHSGSGWYVKWEIFRVSLIVVSLFLWPLALGSMSGDSYILLIYLLLMMETFTWFDFYIKFHIAFYNSKGIYVTHPLSTSKHYLATTFFVDLIAFIPHFQIIYRVYNQMEPINLDARAAHFLLRTLNIYRFLGLAKYLEDKKVIYHSNIFKYFILVTVGLNAYVNFIVYRGVKASDGIEDNYSFNANASLIKAESIVSEYFLELSMILFIIMKIQFFFHGITTFNVFHIMFLALFGWVSQIYMYSFLTLNSMSSNMNFTIYQYYMQSFEKYLTNEKAEDSICNVALAHFEHEWEKKKGEDLHKIFSHFPAILHEDLMFPLYKSTLSAVPCLSGANEAFYRSLSRHVFEIHLKKGSLVIFEKQVQEDIFFIHKGQCSVNNISKTLYVGSMIGDIRGEGLMKNTITAGTHVDLLKIPSKIFFLTMSNFYHTERAFRAEVLEVEDFVESIYIGVKEEEEYVEKNKEFLESEFEVVDDVKKDSKGQAELKTFRAQISEKVIFSPNSKKVRFLNFIFLIDAYMTVTYLPVIIVLGLINTWALITIYLLDFFWVIKILVALRTIYVDPVTGISTTNRKIILSKYLRRLDGLILDCFSVIPFEIIGFLFFFIINSYDGCMYITFSFVNRFVRCAYFMSKIVQQKQKLSVNIFARWFTVLSYKITLLIFFACVHLLLMKLEEHQVVRCNFTFKMKDFDDFCWSLLCVVNNFVGGGMFICGPRNQAEILFTVFFGIWAVLSKAFLVNQVLTILYATHYTKSDQMHKLEELEKYLSVREISPAIFIGIRRYFCNLLDLNNEGAMPYFLKVAPDFIKVNIMEDLYINHFRNCYMFQGIGENFLKQLATRLERFIFFPGDYIVMEGDVDHNMYFVHQGEVYCIQHDQHYRALEKRVDLFVADESFGVMQGLLACCPHNFSYRAKTLADILVLNHSSWEDLREAFPKVTEIINDKASFFRYQAGVTG